MTAKRSLARAAVLAAVLATAGRAQTTEVVSVSAGGGVPNGVTPFDYVSLSSDGRYVAFSSDATDLVPGGTSGRQIFVRDRVTHTTELVSVSTSGGSGNGVSRGPRISEDGRFVAFNSHADDLVAFDGNVFSDVFVRDRQSGTTVRVNVDAGGTPADAGQDLHFYAHSISASGRYVGFASPATNLVPGDTNGVADAFVKDLLTGSIARASLGPGNAEGDAASNGKTSVSADGRYASFSSNATNLVGTDVNGFEDVFVRDLAAGTTELASVSTGGTQANGTSLPCTISADGRYVVFHSNASNLVAGDTNGKYDVFLRDRQNGTTERVSVDSCGGQSDNHSLAHEAISADGRYVAFSSSAANLVPDDLNASRDVFLKDRTTGIVTRASLSSGGREGSFGAAETTPPAISADGQHVGFVSDSAYVPGFNGNMVYVRSRGDTWSFTRFCLPGADGILPCPCNNPPTEPGRGCNNYGTGPPESSRLSATGDAALSNDTILLMAEGENAFSLNVFWQGKSPTIATGIAHGAGVRCVSSTLRRLYTGAANNAMIARPGPSDPSVHDRTASVGSPIACGETRHYFNIYRDPVAAGPCGNSSSTVNLTNAGSITWGP